MRTRSLLKASSLIGLGLGLLSTSVAMAGPKAHGRIAMDETLFMGSVAAKGAEFHSGAQLSTAYIGLDGQYNDRISYNLDLGMNPVDRKLEVSDANITFLFPNFEHLNVSIGQINPAFSIENTNSGAWIPFLTRSMPTMAFGPDQGLGVSATHWSNRYSLSLSLTQPLQGEPASYAAIGSNPRSSDNVAFSGRGAVSVFKNGHDAVQVGVSVHHVGYRRDNAWLRYKVVPEGYGRVTTPIIDTNAVAGVRSIVASTNTTLDGELSAQMGSFWGEFEFQQERIARPAAQTLILSGYHVQTTYFLTGEQRDYNLQNALFKKIKPIRKSGAWEVGARYSYINMNSKEIRGGKANNTTFGINWYSQDNVRVSANYVFSTQRSGAQFGQTKRRLDVLGVRCQYIF